MHATTVSIPSHLCSPPGAQKHATRPQKKWSKLKLKTQHKAKCADFHIMYAVSHIKHAEKKGSMMKWKVCFAPKFLARKILVKGSQKGLKLCWKWYTFCLLTPARAEKRLFRFETEAQLVCMALNTLRRFQQRTKSCLRSSV